LENPEKKRKDYQSVFISDVHLGTKHCKAKKLHQFLDSFNAENLFLVGDIIDGWALRRRHYWTKTQTEVIRRILKLSERMNVYYIAGNHDEFIRPFFRYDFQFGRCQILDSFDYVGVSGKRYYVTHGDYFDLTMKIPTPVINLCAHIWDYIPHKEENNSFTDKMYKVFGTERVIAKYLKDKKYDSCITGHTHSPKIKDTYMNCGDWVTNCSALVEHVDGRWELLYNNVNS
jgi:UDP-2,3-diacylglucosamine pyrophosphatase LpxH